MKLTFIVLSLLFPYLGQAQSKSIDSVFSTQIEFSLISRGNNFPDFNIRQDSAHLFLFSLHKNISIDVFKEKTKFSDEKINQMIGFLKAKNWLHEVDNHLKPTIFIADNADGIRLFEYARPISKQIVKSIEKQMPLVKQQFAETSIAKTQDFTTWSFLVLSNVLLDNWQINNVEKEFLKQSERPLRNGKNYYFKISENINMSKESFGLYGNQGFTIKNKYINVYGNNRVNLKIDSSNHIVSKADNQIFEAMADSFKPNLLRILEKNRSYAVDIYHKMGYAKEITFEEFYIWWYHFIYTQATEQMKKKRMLEIPSSGNFDYKIY